MMRLAVRDRGLAWPAPWQPQGAGRAALALAPTAPRYAAYPSAYASAGAHPLADPAASDALRRRGDEIETAFAAVAPALQALVARQFEPGFAHRAAEELRQRLDLAVPASWFEARWNAPLDMCALHARCVLRTFARLVERGFDSSHALVSDGEPVEALIRRWGFHAIDITPCADGRLAGVVDFILRVPPAVVAYRKSYAGAMFDVEEALAHWEAVELRRWREGRPNAASEPTRYLKVGVYHFSSVEPAHEGCAAHGSDTARAAASLLERLQQFAAAVERTHCCGAQVAILLVGVDTDTDAIRVHVPDADGAMAVERFVCSARLYERTQDAAREAAKEAIRQAVADCAGVAADDAATEGMRWFCGYLLKNNLAQVDAVRARYGGSYPERGHDEKLIVVGDPIDDVQLRNLAFQAQMDSVEEGAGDLAVGVRILGSRHRELGVAVPVLVLQRYDARIPGARDRAGQRAARMAEAVRSRHRERIAAGELWVEAALRADGSARLEFVDAMQTQPRCGCGTESCG